MDLKTFKNIEPWNWPDNAENEILRTLTDGQANLSDRLLAAELVGELTELSDNLVKAVTDIIQNRDEPEDLRCNCAISLGPSLEEAELEGFDDTEDEQISEAAFDKIHAVFEKLFSDESVPKQVRRRALEASVRSPRRWHPDAVRKAYASDDDEWRLTAVFCMRYVEGFEDRILEALDSTNEDIKYEAVCAAGEWGLDAAWPAIAQLIAARKTDKIMLLAAIEAAGRIRRPEATDVLDELSTSDDEDISEAALDALTELGAATDWEFDDTAGDDEDDEDDEDDDEDDNDEDDEDEDDEDEDDDYDDEEDDEDEDEDEDKRKDD